MKGVQSEEGLPNLDDDRVRVSGGELVRFAIALHLERDVESIHGDALLERDLGLDPLDLVLIVLRIEEITGADVAIADLESVRTVHELESVVHAWSLDDEGKDSGVHDSGLYERVVDLPSLIDRNLRASNRYRARIR